jgi:hypothetical protein
VQLIVLSNRRSQYLVETLHSIATHVTGADRITIVDDSGDSHWRSALEYLGDEIVSVDDNPAGYARAMQTVLDVAEGEHVALWEEDFRAIAPIDLHELAGILDERPHLAQLAVMRQPWYPHEIAAGGMLQAVANSGHMVELVDGVWEHRAFFTCNPTVLPRRTYTRPWPQQEWSESAFGRELLKDPAVRFGMMPGQRVEHVGERSGFGY